MLAILAAVGLVPAAAPSQQAAQTPSEEAPLQSPSAQNSTTAPAVSDSTWSALIGRKVVVDTPSGPLTGELLDSPGAEVVLVQEDGSVLTTSKATARSVRVQPAPPKPQQDIEALDPPPAEAEQAPDEDSETAGQRRRRERREQRDFALLGAFTMHGATYTHWRGDGVRAGGASYAMDWGVGFNFSKTFGFYAIAGGLFGTRLNDETLGRARGNYGHVGGIFAYGQQWYYTTIGLAAAFSSFRYDDAMGEEVVERTRGLAIPTRFMARIPLPKKLYIGLGLTYELAFLQNFGRVMNGIGGQLVFGRW